jgi:hypothetical protein
MQSKKLNQLVQDKVKRKVLEEKDTEVAVDLLWETI